jgi:hypothetical protein
VARVAWGMIIETKPTAEGNNYIKV